MKLIVKQSILRLAIFAVALFVAGCRSGELPTAPISGKVLVDNQPLSTGSVYFSPVSGGKGATGKIQEDGTFVLTTYRDGDGAILGEHQVGISAVLPIGSQDGPPGNARPLIPMRYASPGSSKLTCKVTEEGDDNVVFNLSSR